MTIQNDRFLRAISHQPIDCTPVWLMRQAGRYLPEYRALRAEAGDFLTLCKTPELACEVTLQPLRRFPLDAAIVFSDILTIPDAMGLGLQFKTGEGPYFERPLRRIHEIKTLPCPDPETDLRYVLDAIRLIQKSLHHSIPLIGFCGSPWTVACYMVEGCANKSFPKIQHMLKDQPDILHVLLNTLAEATYLHLAAQIEAGVQAVMLFDTWGGLLNTDDYERFSLQYMAHIIRQLNAKVPVIVFTKGGAQWLTRIVQTGCQVVGLDSDISLSDARRCVGNRVALQGNLDVSILYQSPEQIREAVKRVLLSAGEGSGHIFNLSHGIPQDVPFEHVGVLVDAVHSLSRSLHVTN